MCPGAFAGLPCGSAGALVQMGVLSGGRFLRVVACRVGGRGTDIDAVEPTGGAGGAVGCRLDQRVIAFFAVDGHGDQTGLRR